MTKQKYDIGQDNGNKEDDDDEDEDDEYVVGPLLAERASDKEGVRDILPVGMDAEFIARIIASRAEAVQEDDGDRKSVV